MPNMGTCPRHILGRFFCGVFFGIKCASRDVNDGTSHGTTHHKSANSSANIPHGALIAGKLFSNYHLPLFLTCIGLFYKESVLILKDVDNTSAQPVGNLKKNLYNVVLSCNK